VSGDFRRTLQTAEDAEGIAVLLLRASDGRLTFSDQLRLRGLSERYLDYAAALRDVVMPEGLQEDQPSLL
jgi:type IV pilus biogenesis protein CpaD/CtpE